MLTAAAVRYSVWFDVCWRGRGCGVFDSPTKPPYGFEKFRVIGIPQAPAVQVGTQLAECGHELAHAHLRNYLRQRFQGDE
jgi:hypothetical protein